MRAHFDATGSVTVITGGANGIGRALASALAAAGGAVHVLDVAEPTGPLEQGIHAHQVDVADRDAVFAAAAAIPDPVDGLVCGAVIQPRTPVLEMPPEEWRRVLEVNLNGVVWCCQAFVPAMAARRHGSVVLFSSGLAASGYPKASAYASTKGALQAFARSLAKEIAHARVRVNLLSPGVIDTPQFRAANPGGDLSHWQATTGVGQPEDVVGSLMFLLSDAANLTGSLLTRELAFGRSP
jgi:NAD(P)-dependent dehydrogenase (short-subunit alcohol dehydrogenase family)